MMKKADRVLSTANKVDELLSSPYIKLGDRTKAVLLTHVLHSHRRVRAAYPSYPNIVTLVEYYERNLYSLKDLFPTHPKSRVKRFTLKILSLTVAEIRRTIKVVDFEFRRGAIDKNIAKEEIHWLNILSSSIQLDEQHRLANVAKKEGRIGSARSHFENVRKIGLSLSGTSVPSVDDAFISMGVDVDGKIGDANDEIEKIKIGQSASCTIMEIEPDEYDVIFNKKKVNWHIS